MLRLIGKVTLLKTRCLNALPCAFAASMIFWLNDASFEWKPDVTRVQQLTSWRIR